MISFEDINERINICLERLYSKDKELFKKNDFRGVCERCLTFRFAYYLQLKFPEYCVDCDYNSSFAKRISRSGKLIKDREGTFKKRFVDIIIHKRTSEEDTDFLCFEIKKWNSYNKGGYKKDEDNLKYLTSAYGYRYGFHILLGKDLASTRIISYKRNMLNTSPLANNNLNLQQP